LVGDRKGIWPVKTSASKPLGMAINISGWSTVQSILWTTPPACFKKKGVKSFGLSREDAQEKNDWRLRIKGQLATQVYLESGR